MAEIMATTAALRDNQIFDTIIFSVAGATKNKLRGLLRKIDYGPSLGNYSVSERDDGSFLLTELDLASARSGVVKIKGNQIWTPRYFFSAIEIQLKVEKLVFDWRHQTFIGAQAFERAFERA